MRSEELEYQINRTADKIQELEEIIRERRKKQEELEDLLDKVGKLHDALREATEWSVKKIDGSITQRIGRVAAAVIRGDFFDDVLEAIRGSQYRRTDSGMNEAEERVRSSIERIIDEIEADRERIRQMEYQIDDLKREKDAALAEELSAMEA